MSPKFEVRLGFFNETAHGIFDADSPFCWEFETEEEARALYAELDPMEDLDKERSCNRFCEWAGAFKEIVNWPEDDYFGDTIEREEFR